MPTLTPRLRARLAAPAAALLTLAACADSTPVAPTGPAGEPAVGRLGPRGARRAISPASLYGATYVEAFDIYKPEPLMPDSTVTVESVETRVVVASSGEDSVVYDTTRVKRGIFPDSAYWLRAPAIWMPSTFGAALPSPTPSDSAYNAFNPFYGEVRPALTNWAIVKHDKDDSYAMRPMMAWHNATTCAAPPQTHEVSSFDRSTYLCRNHMMTAVNARTYGVTYLTPNRLLDLSSIGAGGTAVVRFDVATLRATKNDWIDLWITPYGENLVAPLDEGLRSVDLQGQPSYGLHIRMTADAIANSAFKADYIGDHKSYPVPVATTAGYETKFAQSATQRRRFELRITNTTISFGMPNESLWWILDAPLPVPVSQTGITKAVVQIGHHSMGVTGTAGDMPTTWHWDNVGVSPSVPFTIINADRRYVDQANAAAPAQFGRAAPAQSHLRFAGYGSKFEVSFNGGPWQKAQMQDEQYHIDGRFHSYWTPVPTGTTRVAFRASNDPADGKRTPQRWMARDLSIWSQNP